MPDALPLPPSPRAFHLSIASAAGFAGMNACARQAGLAGAHFAVIGAWRAFVGGTIALLFARAAGQSLRISDYGPMWKRTVFGTLSMTTCFYVLGMHVLSVANTATLFALAPVFVALLAPWLLRERSGARLLPALLVCVLGVMLILNPGGGVTAPHHVQHTLIAVASAFFASLAMIYLRAMGPKESSATVALHFSYSAFLIFVVIACVAHTSLSWHAWPWMLGAGVCAGVAQLLMTSAYQHDHAARVSMYSYVAIPFSALLEAVFGQRYPSWGTVIGALLVAGAGTWLARSRPTDSVSTS